MELFIGSWLWPVYAALLGVIVGSFLNVFLYRFHTGKSLNGSSHCLSCHVTLRWYELVPLVSYVVLRGRCRTCGSWIPSRYFVVEFLTGWAFWLAVTLTPMLIMQLVVALFLSVLILVVVYDLYHTIIPDEFVWLLGFIALGKLIIENWQGGLWAGIGLHLIAGLSAAGPFVFLWVISEGRWIGLGDAKLAFPLGMWLGLGGVVSLVMFSFWIGACLSVMLIGVQTMLKRGQFGLRILGRALTMKSEVPFAPFLVLSFLVVYIWHVNAMSLIMYAL